MKNLKKVIILSIILVVSIIYIVYNYINEATETFIEDEVYVDTNINMEKANDIILHITGEVNNPRYYKNRRRLKTC